MGESSTARGVRVAATPKSAQILSLIIDLSVDKSNYRSEWALVQTVTSKTGPESICLCESQTKNYRVYFNLLNGNIIKLGIDCRSNHSESFTEIRLADTVPDTIVGRFLNLLIEPLLIYNSIHVFISTPKRETKSPELILQGAVNKTLETILSSHDSSAVFSQIGSLFRFLNTVITVPKYQKYFSNKANASICNAISKMIEGDEISRRKSIMVEEAQELRRLTEGVSKILESVSLMKIEAYLASLPAMISNNLRATYILPNDAWQLQQTNGYIKWWEGKDKSCDPKPPSQ